MASSDFPKFKAKNVLLWTVNGTGLTVFTDADRVLGRLRSDMRNAIKRMELGGHCPRCVHFVDSPLGVPGGYGTEVHGRSWKVHKPRGGKLDLWEAFRYASSADWTEVEPTKLRSDCQMQLSD